MATGEPSALSRMIAPGSPAADELDRCWCRAWRPSLARGVVVLHVRRMCFRRKPSGEHLFTYVAGGRVDVVRGGRRYRLRPGDLAAWDPSGPHGILSGDGRAFELRMLLIELPTPAEVLADPAGCRLDAEFGDPLLPDPEPGRFLRLHRALAERRAPGAPSVVADWVRRLDETAAAEARELRQRRIEARHDPVLLAACELLHRQPALDFGIEAIAARIGADKHRLIRLFKTGLGLPPRAYRVQLRVQHARGLLEHGHTPAPVSQLAGFCDQSHLHRHFTPRIGLTRRATPAPSTKGAPDRLGRRRWDSCGAGPGQRLRAR